MFVAYGVDCKDFCSLEVFQFFQPDSERVIKDGEAKARAAEVHFTRYQVIGADTGEMNRLT